MIFVYILYIFHMLYVRIYSEHYMYSTAWRFHRGLLLFLHPASPSPAPPLQQPAEGRRRAGQEGEEVLWRGSQPVRIVACLSSRLPLGRRQLLNIAAVKFGALIISVVSLHPSSSSSSCNGMHSEGSWLRCRRAGL